MRYLESCFIAQFRLMVSIEVPETPRGQTKFPDSPTYRQGLQEGNDPLGSTWTQEPEKVLIRTVKSVPLFDVGE